MRKFRPGNIEVAQALAWRGSGVYVTEEPSTV